MENFFNISTVRSDDTNIACTCPLCETLKQLGVIEYLYVDMYEASHKRFKQIYAKPSRRKQTSMDEVVTIENASKNHFRDIGKYFQRSALVAYTDVIRNDSAYLNWSRPKSSLRFLESYLRKSRCAILKHQHDEKEHGICSALFKRLRSDGFQVFLRLVSLYIDDCKEKMSSACHKKLQFSSSAYVSGIKTPTPSGKILDCSLLFQCSSTLISQTIVPANSFHGSKEGRFDSLMVFCEESKYSDYIQLWFVRVLALVWEANSVNFLHFV